MKTTIYMVRHAESPFVFGEERTRGLSEEGFTAAKRVAERFANIHVDYIASSAYTRAVQTVQDVADQKGLPIVAYEELIERPIKGLNYKAPWDELEHAIRKSFEDDDYAMPGGETVRLAQQRAIPVMEQWLKERQGQTIVVGTHGQIMTTIMKHYDASYGYAFWQSTSKPDIYRLTFNGQTLEQVERMWDGV